MNVDTQKKKVVLLACLPACMSLPGILITRHLHNSPHLSTFVICWLLLMVSILAFAVFELTKLIKLRRGEAV